MKNKCPCCGSEINYSLIPVSRDPDSEACCYNCLPKDMQKLYDEFFERGKVVPSITRGVMENIKSD